MQPCKEQTNRARQRSIIIRQDTAERKKRAATKAVRRSLPEDPDVAVALVVETELEREEAMRRRCEVEQAELAAGKIAAAKAQSVRNALVEDSNESHSAEQLPVVDGSVSQQHRLQSLRKIQLWAWRRRVQDNMDQIKLCFQKWVAGGLAGCFIRKYTRRLEKDECHAVQVAAARHSAATVLRTVLLYRAVKVAQCSISDLTYLKDSFGGWLWCAKRDIRNRMRDIRWLCDIVMRRVYNMEVGMAWRQWKFWSGVHKAEKVLRDFGVESLRGATRQWVFNLWCTVCSATIAAIAKAEAAKKITGAETLERVVVRLMIRGATRQWISNWCGAVQKAEVAETARVEAEAAEAIKLIRVVARARVCECYEDMEGLVLCANCCADTENVLAKKKQWYAQQGAVVKIQCGATWKYL